MSPALRVGEWLVRTALVGLVACMWILMVSGPAEGSEQSVCKEQELKSADVSVRLEIRRSRFDDWFASSTTTIEVPADWPLAEHLLWEEPEDRYLTAMRCLLGPTDAHEKHRRPTVVKRGDELIVTDVVRITTGQPYPRERLGFWHFELGPREWWFWLATPKTLEHAQWSWVTVAYGIPVKSATPMPSHKDTTGTLTWSRWTEPDSSTLQQVAVSLTPPNPMALAWVLNQGWRWLVPLGLYGMADLLVYLPVVVIALQLRGTHDRGSRIEQAASWILRIVAGIGAAHGLVIVGSALTELVWWSPLSEFGDLAAVWESVALVSVLAVTGLLAVRWLRDHRTTAIALGIGALVGVFWLAWVARVESWRPAITEPFSADIVPIALGGVAGLAAIAAYAGVTARIWKAGGWTISRTAQMIGIPLLAVGLILGGWCSLTSCRRCAR